MSFPLKRIICVWINKACEEDMIISHKRAATYAGFEWHVETETNRRREKFLLLDKRKNRTNMLVQ